jgi:serralysin
VVNGAVGLDPGDNRIFATIWDGGGKDTYDLSAYRTGLRLDLRPGKASEFSEPQLADLGGGPNDGHARGNVFNALQFDGDRRSLIENAEGGSGGDRIIGNAAGNRLEGGRGGDVLKGLTGKDVLVGGKGDDCFVFSSTSHSRAGSADKLFAGGGVRAFEAPGAGDGDLIDLRGIDDDTTRAGDQAFAFGEGHGRGHLWLENRGKVTYVCGNTDRDAKVEFELAIHDWGVKAAAYSADDFVL